MTPRVVRNLSVRLEQKRIHDKLATGAQCVPAVIPETRLNVLMTTRIIRTQSVRLKQKGDQDKLSTGAQSLPDIIPETKLKLTHDVANCSQSVRAARAKKEIMTS